MIVTSIMKDLKGELLFQKWELKYGWVNLKGTAKEKLNPADPTENYVYARSYGQNVTIGNLAKAFGLTMEIPEPIAMSGFCGELKFSFSMSEEGQFFFGFLFV